MTDKDTAAKIEAALETRFGEPIAVDPKLSGLDELERIASHSSHRKFKPDEIEPALIRLLCASALSAPAKSDLQQADILIVSDRGKRDAITSMLTEMWWTSEAPVFLVFLANGRRLPQFAKRHGTSFPNDHLDQFFNASVDAGIVLATFLRAAEAVGLGCCPISVIRDHAAKVSDILDLPDRVIPVAGMCAGWPNFPSRITPRLPLSVTLHENTFSENATAIEAYDQRRESVRPYTSQRDVATHGRSDAYGWSMDKARQYSTPQRADFGAFVRAKGFKLD
jgi:nitroreductase/FMN reductase [NAD(P)H]